MKYVCTVCGWEYDESVGYPEGGIGSVIYIKRIRLNAGGDYAQFRDVGRDGMARRRISFRSSSWPRPSMCSSAPNSR